VAPPDFAGFFVAGVVTGLHSVKSQRVVCLLMYEDRSIWALDELSFEKTLGETDVFDLDHLLQGLEYCLLLLGGVADEEAVIHVNRDVQRLVSCFPHEHAGVGLGELVVPCQASLL
jgi:hypothetical protein